MCSAGGRVWYHSIDEDNCIGKEGVRWAIILSQIINIKKITPNNEIVLPREETIFHAK